MPIISTFTDVDAVDTGLYAYAVPADDVLTLCTLPIYASLVPVIVVLICGVALNASGQFPKLICTVDSYTPPHADVHDSVNDTLFVQISVPSGNL